MSHRHELSTHASGPAIVRTLLIVTVVFCGVVAGATVGSAKPSPKDMIVFNATSLVPNLTQIAIGRVDGSGIVNLSKSTTNDIRPRVSPDGKKIAFQRAAPNTSATAVWVMNIDGSGQAAVTDPSLYAYSPSWYPDGKSLAVAASAAASVPAPFQVWKIGVDGQGKQQLTHGADRKDSPAISADGSRLIYSDNGVTTTKQGNVTTTKPSVTIHEASAADGSGDHAITDGTHLDLNPVYGPPGSIYFDRGEDQPPAKVMVMRSTDGGLTWSAPEEVSVGAQPTWDGAFGLLALTVPSGQDFSFGYLDPKSGTPTNVPNFSQGTFNFNFVGAPTAAEVVPAPGKAAGPGGAAKSTTTKTDSPVLLIAGVLAALAILAGGAFGLNRLRKPPTNEDALGGIMEGFQGMGRPPTPTPPISVTHSDKLPRHCGPRVDEIFVASLNRTLTRLRTIFGPEPDSGAVAGLAVLLTGGVAAGYMPVDRNGVAFLLANGGQMDFRTQDMKSSCHGLHCEGTITLCGQCHPQHIMSDFLYGFVCGYFGLGQDVTILGALAYRTAQAAASGTTHIDPHHYTDARPAYRAGVSLGEILNKPAEERMVTIDDLCRSLTGEHLGAAAIIPTTECPIGTCVMTAPDDLPPDWSLEPWNVMADRGDSREVKAAIRGSRTAMRRK